MRNNSSAAGAVSNTEHVDTDRNKMQAKKEPDELLYAISLENYIKAKELVCDADEQAKEQSE